MFQKLIYLTISLSVIFYALPNLDFFSSNLYEQIFSIVWTLFAIVILGSHLQQLININEDRRRKLFRVKRYGLWRREQEILNAQSDKGIIRSYLQ